jgi:pilus assembly protein CpaB
VRVNDVIGVAGFALPGSYIDIIANVRDNQGQSYSKVVLSRVKVLAIAQETEVDKTKPKVVNAVTLELTPEESERLDLARSIGTLSLVLRNELDMSVQTSKGAKMQDLLKNHALSIDENEDDKKMDDSNKVNSQPSSSGRIEQIRGSNRNSKNIDNE